jgi:hypothetical protein
MKEASTRVRMTMATTSARHIMTTWTASTRIKAANSTNSFWGKFSFW